MFITRASKGIVSWIYNNLDDEKRTRFDTGKTSIIELENRLKVLFIYILVGSTLLISSNWISKKELLLSLMCVVAIRLSNGGHHFKPELCYAVTSGVVIGIPLISPYINDLKLYIFLLTIIISFIYAPFTKRNGKHDFLRKIIALIVTVTAYILRLEILMTALFILSLDLIKYRRR